MACLAGILAWCAPAAGELTGAEARLANGAPIEGALQETTAEGMTFQTSHGAVSYPWKHLSAGTRYRHERPFLAEQAVRKSKAVQPAPAEPSAAKTPAAPGAAKPTAPVKPAPTNTPAPAQAKP